MKNGQFDANGPMPGRTDVAGGNPYDVAILGAGVGGGMLAAILARHSLRVLLVEADSHPRFTIGESTIPETAGLLRVVGERYSVPEIAHLATFQSVRHHVTSACGVKRGFSFIYHREGEPQRPEESTQFPTLAHRWAQMSTGSAKTSTATCLPLPYVMGRSLVSGCASLRPSGEMDGGI